MRLEKSLYGLKEAGRLWYQLLRSKLVDLGFVSGTTDPCVFRHKHKKIVLLVYVDDCLIAATNEDTNWLTNELKKTFSLKQSDLKDFLGMEIVQENNRICVNFRNYITNLVKEAGLEEAHTHRGPLFQ